MKVATGYNNNILSIFSLNNFFCLNKSIIVDKIQYHTIISLVSFSPDSKFICLWDGPDRVTLVRLHEGFDYY